MIPERRKRNASKISLIVSIAIHAAIILVILFFAAREGLVGKKLRQLAVTMVPKEKPPEPPKEKPPEPKLEQPKTQETPKLAANPPPVEAPPPAAPPASASVEAPPMAAPAAVSLPSFEFNDGAKAVQTISDPSGIYKALVEHVLHDNWNRPEDIADDNYAAMLELSVDSSGRVNDYRCLSGSGDKRWDDSVRAAMEQTKTIGHPPPKGFPTKFNVRFD